MTAAPETGFLLVADLTGYTAYLSGAEIEHAPTIAGDLLETIVGRLEPPFRLAKFEGDAAFLYAEDGRAEPGLLLDAIDACYLAFRRRLRSIEQATSCDCSACRTAQRLDLKFFVHHGQYVRTRIAGRDELAGSSIIVVHRLLKGETASRAHDAEGRASGFVVYTGEAIANLRLDDKANDMARSTDTIDHLGEVTTFVHDLEARWQEESGARRLEVPAENLLGETVVVVPADPPAVWSHLTSPALRARWEGTLVIADGQDGGRPGPGTTLQCVTGRLASIEEIVDWQPFDHLGFRVITPGVGPVDATYDLEPRDGGTAVRLRWGGDALLDRERGAELFTERQAAIDRLATIASEPFDQAPSGPPATLPAARSRKE